MNPATAVLRRVILAASTNTGDRLPSRSVLAVFLVLISGVKHEFVVLEEVLIAVREPDVNSERQFLSDNPDSLRAPVHDLLAHHRISHDGKLSVGHIDLADGIEGGVS
jgi:hypothetical protein